MMVSSTRTLVRPATNAQKLRSGLPAGQSAGVLHLEHDFHVAGFEELEGSGRVGQLGDSPFTLALVVGSHPVNSGQEAAEQADLEFAVDARRHALVVEDGEGGGGRRSQRGAGGLAQGDRQGFGGFAVEVVEDRDVERLVGGIAVRPVEGAADRGVVLSGGRGAVRSVVLDRGCSLRAAGPAHADGGLRQSLGDAERRAGELDRPGGGSPVVVDDGHGRVRRVAENGAAGGAAELQIDRLVGLVIAVVGDGDVERLDAVLAVGPAQRAGRGGVVLSGGGAAVGGAEAHAHGAVVTAEALDLDGGGADALGAAVARVGEADRAGVGGRRRRWRRWWRRRWWRRRGSALLHDDAAGHADAAAIAVHLAEVGERAGLVEEAEREFIADRGGVAARALALAAVTRAATEAGSGERSARASSRVEAVRPDVVRQRCVALLEGDGVADLDRDLARIEGALVGDLDYVVGLRIRRGRERGGHRTMREPAVV